MRLIIALFIQMLMVQARQDNVSRRAPISGGQMGGWSWREVVGTGPSLRGPVDVSGRAQEKRRGLSVTTETSDGDILCAIYNAATSKSLLTNWCGAKSNGNYVNGPCTGTAGKWNGVTNCAGTRVSVVDFNSADPPITGIGGSIPTEIGGLNALTFLYLGGNSLTGSCPSELGLLTNLSDMVLDDNSLVGSLPSSLGGLISLTYLSVNNNNIVGAIPSQLGLLSKLSYLDISVNKLSGAIPSSLGGLTELTSFYMDTNSLIGSVPATFCALNPSVDLTVNANSGLTCYPSCLSSFTTLTKDTTQTACTAGILLLSSLHP